MLSANKIAIRFGEGVVATDTEEHRVFKGDFILIPAEERHWHGATEDSAVTQLSVGVPGTSRFDGEFYTASE